MSCKPLSQIVRYIVNLFIGRYNYAHSATRMCIERIYGQLKRRFSLLQYGLRFRKIEDSANLITAAVCLFNFCKQCGVEEFDESEDEIDMDAFNLADDMVNQNQNLTREGEIKGIS